MKDDREAVDRACLGNAAAAQFLDVITEVLHFWDDLIDKDKPISDAEVNRCMWKALIELPRNTFYMQNFSSLNMVLVNAIVNWRVATDMERQPHSVDDELIAFIVRSSYIDLVTAVAAICGGQEHATKIMLEARRLWHSEGLHGYRESLVKERIAREGVNHEQL